MPLNPRLAVVPGSGDEVSQIDAGRSLVQNGWPLNERNDLSRSAADVRRAWDALWAPVRGRRWTPYDLTLGINTLVAPIIGAPAFRAGFGERTSRPPRAFVSMSIGILVPCAVAGDAGPGGSGASLIWYALMPAVAVLLFQLSGAHRGLARAVVFASGQFLLDGGVLVA